MFLKTLPGTTLTDLGNAWEDGTEQTVTVTKDIHFDLPEDGRGAIEIKRPGKGGKRPTKMTLPYTTQGAHAFATAMHIPWKYLERLPRDMRGFLLNETLKRFPLDVRIAYSKELGITRVMKPETIDIPPARIVQVASQVIDPTAEVTFAALTPDEIAFDVVAPAGFDRGIGGDSKVGDITRGGLRMGQDIKRNLAPYAQRYWMRLLCTNGMEAVDNGLKIDARGSSVDEVLAELEQAAEIAFSTVEARIASHYALRAERVNEPAEVLLRMATEHGIPPRYITTLQSLIPAVRDEGNGEVSMFDLVNLITNYANHPSFDRQPGTMRTLQRVGGAIVTEHAERCRVCSTRLN